MNPFDPTALGFGEEPAPQPLSQNKAAALRMVMMGAASTDPKQHAGEMKIARELAVPPEFVANLPQRGKALPPNIDYEELAREYPKTADYLSDPNHAKISKYDIESLKRIERSVSDIDIESRGLFDDKTRDRIVSHLKDNGYEIDIAPSAQVESRRSRNFALQNMNVFEQIGANIAGGYPFPEDVPKEQRVELPTDPRDWMDALAQGLEKGKPVPFGSSASDLDELSTMAGIGRRAERDEMTNEDWAYLLKQDNEIRRGSTRAARVTDIVVMIPGFAGEISISMGAGRAASASTRAALHGVRKNLAKRFESTLAKSLIRSSGARVAQNVAGAAVRGAVQTAISGTARAAVETYRLLLPQFKGLDDKQIDAEYGALNAIFEESQYTFFEALGRAYGEQYIEIGSELLGIKISKVYAALANKSGASGLMAAIVARYLKFNPTKTIHQVAAELKKYGWDGILTEWTEERLGDVARMALGWQEAKINTEQWVDEIIAFSISGGAGYGAAMSAAYKNAVGAAQQARNQQEIFEALRDGADLSQTRTLVPGLQALQAQMAAARGPVDSLYFPLEDWNGYWESKGRSGRAEALKLGISEEEFDALSEGNKGIDLKIPIGQYIEYLAPSEHNEGLSQIARLFEDAPNLRDLKQIAQEQIAAHSSLTALMQTRREAEAEQEQLTAETQKLQADLTELMIQVKEQLDPAQVQARAEALAAATTDEERASILTQESGALALQARTAEMQQEIADKLQRIENINTRLTELRRQELSFSQAGINDSVEAKSLADQIYSELSNTLTAVQSEIPKGQRLGESELRLNAAMAARMVATLAERGRMTIPEFTERFALEIRPLGMVMPVSRVALMQSRAQQHESEYARAIEAKDIPEAQRIVDLLSRFAGIKEQLPPFVPKADGTFSSLSEIFGKRAVQQFATAQLQAAYQSFTYSMEMMIGNNVGSPLAPLIDAPLWVKLQFDEEMRAAYSEPGTGADLLAQAFGLIQFGNTVAPSAYVNQGGSLEINPSGQMILIPEASAELDRPGWGSEIEASREVLPGETWQSIIETGLFPELVSARAAVSSAEKELKGKRGAERKSAQEKVDGAKQAFANLEKTLGPVVRRALKKIYRLNGIEPDAEGRVPKPKGEIKFLTRSSARLKAYALAHGIIQQQEAISGHVAIPLEAGEGPQDANGVSIVLGRPLTDKEISDVFNAAVTLLGADGAKNLGYFPTPTGYKLINFGADQTKFLQLLNYIQTRNLIQPGQGNACFFKLNWDLGIYEVNGPTSSGLSVFEEKLRQSGFWTEFLEVRDRIEPRRSALSALWEERIRIFDAQPVKGDVGWTAALEATGGVANISRTPLAGIPVLNITSAQDVQTILSNYLQQNPNASEEQIAEEAARLIRLDAYQVVENQEAVEGRTRAEDRKKRVEQLANLALSKIQSLPFVPQAMKLSMAEISIGALGQQQKMETVMDFLVWAEGELGDVIGKSDPALLTGEEKIQVAEALYYFALARLAAKQASGVDWYLAAVQAAMTIVHNVHPELRTDRDLERLYKALIAVTSQGQRVEQNFVFADSVYRFFQEFQKLPNLVSFGGKSKTQIEKNLVKLQNLINSRGLKAAMDLLEQEMTAKEVDALYDEVLPGSTEDTKKLVSGELSNTRLRGSMLLGPKIGSFFGNLQFLFNTVTMDLWFTRTIQRILGRPFGITVGDETGPKGKALAEHGRQLSYNGLKGSLQRLLFALELKKEKATNATKEKKAELTKAALEAARAFNEAPAKASKATKKSLQRAKYEAEYELAQYVWTDEDKQVVAEIEKFLKTPSDKIGNRQTQVAPMLARTMAYSEPVHRLFAADGYELKTEFNRATKTIDETLTKGQEAPSSGEYRNAVREIMEILRVKLLTDGIDLAHADSQAVLWYGEKDLYWMFGVADAAEGQDYATSAAYLYYEKLQNAQRPHRELVGHDSLPGDLQKFGTESGKPAPGPAIITLQQRVKRGRDPVLQQAAEDLADGKITSDEYRRMVDQRAPLGEFDEVPEPATAEEIAYGLGDRPVRAGDATLKRDLIIGPEQVGQRIVESRLDIPAYDQRGVWVVSLHEDTGPLREDFRGAGPVVGYTNAVHLRGVQFRTQQKAALKIAAGASKSTIATMRGENIPHASEQIYAEAQAAMSDPSWVEVGFNPIRSSMFYRKDNGAPVTDAAEIIQVGGMVLAKSPTADTNVVRLYQLVWHYSDDLFNRMSAHQADNVSGLGWGLYFSDAKEMADAYRRVKSQEEGRRVLGNAIMYSVDIPEDTQLLNMAGTITEQPLAVQAALRSSLVDSLDDASKKSVMSFRMGLINAFTLYAKLAGGKISKSRLVGGDAQQASLLLKSLGIPGSRYTDDTGVSSFVIWDDAAVAVMYKIRENDSSAANGQLVTDFNERGLMRRKFALELSSSTDASTFMHEMMHFYLEALGDLAAAPDAPAEVRAEMEAVMQWWQRRPDRVKDLAFKIASLSGSLSVANAIKALSEDELKNAILHWRQYTPVNAAIGVALHELLAENWEGYLYDGKAPTPEVQMMFQRFKRWMSKVYTSAEAIGLSSQNAFLTDEIRGFFDKVVASEVEIKAAEARESVDPLFANKPDGMPDAVWEQYRSFLEKASERAREKIGAELMASERALARKERAAFREKITEELRGNLVQRPDYIALALLRTGKTPDGQELKPPLKAFKLNKASLEAMPDIDKPKMKRLRNLGVYSAAEGISPDQAAEILGFDSGQHLVDTLLNIRPMADVLKEQVKQAVDEAFPTLLDNPKELSKAASEAVRNEFREDVIAIEMAELQRAIRADKKALRRIVNSVPRPLGAIAARILEGTEAQADAAIGILGSYKILRDVADEQAAKTLGSMRLRDIRPAMYAAAARRNAQAATRFAAAGKYLEALSAKEAELANTALHRRAVDIREIADKQAAWLQSRNGAGPQSKLGLAGGSYQEQMNALLERFNFRPIPLTQVDKLTRLREWVEAQQARGYTINIDEDLLDEAFRKDFREMTSDELTAVWEAAKQIYHLAKTKLEIKIGRERKEFKDLVDTLTATISANKKPKVRPIGALSKSEKLANRIAAQFGSMRKLASLVRELDGLTDGGPLYWAFMDPINKAGDQEAAMREEALVKLQKIFDAYTRAERTQLTKRQILTINGKQFSLSKEDMLTMALNWGNETSRQRLVTGIAEWNQDDVEQILGRLEKRDWDFVQSVWDMLETYWPAMEAKQKRVYGITPERVEPAPVPTTFGVYRGGYYPLKYRGAKSEFENQADAAKAMMAGSVGASTTKRGHFKERLKFVDRPVRLGFEVLHEHLNQIIHDLTHHEMLIQTTRILRNKAVASAIETYYGTDVLVTMQSLLDQIAIGDTHGTEHGSMLYKYLRNGAQTSIMGYNLMTSLQQVFGLTQSINRVGAMPIVKAVSRWLTSAPHAENTVEWIYSKSSLMRLRGKTQDRELNEIYNTINPDSRTAIRASFYYLILKGQMLADVPTWLAAYDNALSAGSTDEQATALADQAVIDTQGSGMIKDLALAQQGGAFQRLFTLFYSYFSATYNLNVEVLKGISVNGKAELGRAIVDLLTLNSLPVAINVLAFSLIGKYGDDDDLMKRLAKEQFGYLLNQSLFTREFVGMLEGRGYEGPAGLRPIAEIYKLGRAVSADAEDEGVRRSTLVQLNKVAGTLFHYPAVQLQRTVEGAKALWEGQTRNPLVLLRGPTKEERGK